MVDPMMAVTWSERYNKTFEKIWAKLPNFVGSFIATAAVFILGSSIHADWLLILVHFIKYLRHGEDEKDNGTMSASNDTESLHKSKDNDDGLFSLENYKLQGLAYYIFPALIVSYVTYLGVGGFLHWYYYVRQRDRPEEWKCQPTKWLSPELERHEILLGSLSLFFRFHPFGHHVLLYHERWRHLCLLRLLSIWIHLGSSPMASHFHVAGLFNVLGS